MTVLLRETRGFDGVRSSVEDQIDRLAAPVRRNSRTENEPLQQLGTILVSHLRRHAQGES